MKLTVRFAIATALASMAVFILRQPMDGQTRPVKPGVSTPGVKIPLSELKPEAVIPIPGSPDWIAVGESVWVSNSPKGTVTRINPTTATVEQTLTGFRKPCSGLAIGFGSLWIPNCGDKTLDRVDLATGRVTKTVPMGVADSEGGIAVGAGSVWMMTDGTSTLSEIDPATDKVVSKTQLPAGCYTPLFGFESVWVTCTKQNTLIRVDPRTKGILATVPVGPQPRFLSAGEGAVWTLNQGDGTVTRVNPQTNRVAATIAVGIPGEGGDISAGEGSVWATSFGFPVSRIDPATNEVVQQFVGTGGDAIRAGGGLVWLSNYMLHTEWKIDPAKVTRVSP